MALSVVLARPTLAVAGERAALALSVVAAVSSAKTALLNHPGASTIG